MVAISVVASINGHGIDALICKRSFRYGHASKVVSRCRKTMRNVPAVRSMSLLSGSSMGGGVPCAADVVGQLKGVARRSVRAASSAASSVESSTLDALIFDCDGVIVESDGIHREAYNAAFQHFNVVCPGTSGPLVWTEEFYDMLQNKVGGGKPKMRWYFGRLSL